jgi:site-specific recombinase XerD
LKFAITLNDQQLKREIAFYEEVIKVKADVAALLTFLVLCATLLKASGADIKVMQELLRHASTHVTLDTYTQAVTPAKRAAQTAVITQFFPSAKTA